MAKEVRRIPFEEFSDNLTDIFEEVIKDHKTVVVESEFGELVELKPITPPNSRQRLEKSKEDEEAFLSAAGGWADFDIDTFLKANEESRL
jgi:hypothetical protein